MKLWALAALLVCLLPTDTDAQETRRVAGVVYEEDGGRWYQVDADGGRWEVRPGRVGVRFDGNLPADRVDTIFADLGLSLRQPHVDLGGFYRFSYDDRVAPPDILAAVLAAPYVERAYLDGYLKFFAAANDSFYVNQWNLVQARVNRAWDVTGGVDTVTIAVIDLGFEIGHEDLEEVIWINPAEDINHNGIFDNYPASSGGDIDNADNDVPINHKADDVIGWDFTSGDNIPEPTPDDPHGTQVAGIACASASNEGKGIAGVAGGRGSGGARLMPLRLVSYDDASDAIEYAWQEGADIISMSWGYAGDPAGAVSAAIENAYDYGTVLLAGTGNAGFTGPNYDSFPSTHPYVIAVGSSDEHDDWIPFSNYGAHLDLVAPSSTYGGPDPAPYIWTTDDYISEPGSNPNSNPFFTVPANNGKYWGRFAGTSAACPFAAGVAALVKSHMPGLTSEQVRQRLLTSAVDVDSVGFDWKTGWGRVDAYRALTEWGTITEDVTWSPSDTHDGVRYVSGDLTVAPGVTLTILPGTIIKIANDDDLQASSDTTRIEINVEGSLVANGTETEPIIFEPWHPTTTEDWVGIYFDSLSGGGTFGHCIIKRAEYAIESYVPLTLRNTEIDSCRYASVVSQDGGAFLKGCELTQPGTFGVFLTSGASVIRNTVVDAATSTGIQVQPSADLIVRASTVANCDTGLYVNGNATVDFDSTCYVWMNDTGIHFYNAGSLSAIQGTGITWNASTALLCDNSSPKIEANTFAHNGSGIYCSNSSSPVIELNKMQTSGNAVTAISSSSPDVGHTSPAAGQSAGNNQIAHTTKYVANYTASTIQAQNNCWNLNTPPCSPQLNRFVGSVDYSDPNCCSFPLFSHGEGEPEPSEFVFQLPKASPSESGKPVKTGLVSIVPNPFNPTTTVHYSLAARGHVEIKIYDVGGRLVRVLADETQVPGQHAAPWNGMNARGSPVASGIYFVRMTAAGQVFTRKMVLLK